MGWIELKLKKINGEYNFDITKDDIKKPKYMMFKSCLFSRALQKNQIKIYLRLVWWYTISWVALHYDNHIDDGLNPLGY